VILDYWGHREGRHRAQERAHRRDRQAGNPDVQPGVNIVIGPGTEIIAGEGSSPPRAASIHTYTSSARSKWKTR